MDGVWIAITVLVAVCSYLGILVWNFSKSKPQDYPQCKQCGKNSWTEVNDGKHLYKCDNCGHPDRFRPEDMYRTE